MIFFCGTFLSTSIMYQALFALKKKQIVKERKKNKIKIWKESWHL